MNPEHINIHDYAHWRQQTLKSFQVTYSNYLNETPLRSTLPPSAPDVSVQAYVEHLLEQGPSKENH